MVSSKSSFYHLADEPVSSPIVLGASEGEALIVPGADALLHADFSRISFDLLITMTDGTQFLIVEYFSQVNPSTLMTDGGSALPPDLISALAGPMAPGQYADVEGTVEQQAIGRVDHTLGEVTATRVDGTTVALNKESPVYQGDILETGKDGAVSVVFIDETEFSLGTDGRMVLDELIFDPSSLEGSSTFSVIQGVFVFVSGEIAANNPEEMVVRTPVATLGIRGTKVAGRAAAEGDLNVVTLMPENNGVTGTITVSNGTGTVTLSNAFETTTIKSIFNAPERPSYINENQANSLFGGVDKLLATNIAAQRSEKNNKGQDDGARQDQDSSSAEENSKQQGPAEKEDGNVEGEQETPLGEEVDIDASEGEESAEGSDGEDQELEDAQLGDETGLVQGSVVVENVDPGEPSGDTTKAGSLANENLIEAALVSENVAFNEFEAALESGADFGEAMEQAIAAQETLLGSIIESGTEAYFESLDATPKYDRGGETEDQDFNLQDIEAFRDQETLAGFAASLTEMGFSSDPNYDQEQDYNQEQGLENFDESSFGEDDQFIQEDGPYGEPGEFSFEGPGISFGDPLLTAFISNPVDFNPLEIIQFGDFQIFDPLFDPLAAVQDLIFNALGIIPPPPEPEDFNDSDSRVSDVLTQEEFESATFFDGTIGADSITGTSGVDIVNALAGDDTISVFSGNDAVLGGPGNDIINGGDGADNIAGDGNSGSITAATVVNLSEASDDGSDTISGGNGDDGIVGLGGNDVITGDAGNDGINGGSGDDSIDGGSGDDELGGGSGNDSLDGGSGNDQIFGGTGDDTLLGGSGDDSIEGGSGNDSLAGGLGDDTLNGREGNDSISGGDGIDLIAGNEGNDILLGGAGNDVIVGDDGADTITGGTGIDVLAGGGGSSLDIFRFVDPTDGSLVSSNVTKGDIVGDTIGDFDPGEDKFQFISSAFGNLSTGTLSVNNFADLRASDNQYNGTNSGKTGAIFIYDNTSTLYFDPDTSSAGYTVIAQTQTGINVARTDIDIVSS